MLQYRIRHRLSNEVDVVSRPGRTLSLANLAADTVQVQASGILGENVVVTYTARNLSAGTAATGAWVDWTLQELKIDAPRLMAGTKGSHFVTYHPALVAALSG